MSETSSEETAPLGASAEEQQHSWPVATGHLAPVPPLNLPLRMPPLAVEELHEVIEHDVETAPPEDEVLYKPAAIAAPSSPCRRAATDGILQTATQSMYEAEHQKAEATSPEQHWATMVTTSSSMSWTDTLAQFPSLMRKYPLASASEVFSEATGTNCAVDDESVPVDSVEDQSTCEESAADKQRGSDRHTGTPSVSAAAASTPQSTVQNMHVVASSSSEIHAAWAAVWEAQRQVEQREERVSQREAAALEAEARNATQAKHLLELREHLDKYSQQVEQAWIQQLFMAGADRGYLGQRGQIPQSDAPQRMHTSARIGQGKWPQHLH